MKFFNLALLSLAFFVTLESPAEDGDFDLERINVSYGRTFHDILILEADTHGLTFRHREGIAKVEFASLPENLRLLYEVTDEVPGTGASEPGEDGPVTEPGAASEPGAVAPVLTVYHRLTASLPNCPWAACPSRSNWVAWPSWWPRYRSPHLLTIPCYRERATRDFLILSGLSGSSCPDWSRVAFGQESYLAWRPAY